ncbi:GEVED domain-containing protein [Vallitalea okinawensis]|uniref:GEVED domain-containing protein n=1 Tax=Vallitalea okinawensis TaxID=2078660 RepID=UPI000CFCE7E4|nr:GEVED domain-containing protein [Vallitalea okinawensis]
MTRKIFLSVSIIFCMIFNLFMSTSSMTVEAAEEPVAAIFGGGPFVSGGQSVVDDIKSSGFNTVMIWAVHVRADGDLYLNDLLVCENGVYVGDASWASNWADLKQGTTSVNRVEISVGAWGSDAFENIKNLINADGTGSDTVLYKNFKALMEATGADAVNYDDEVTYDVTSAVQFGQMCNAMGMKVTLCPYTNSSFWQSVKNQLGSVVDRVYLQCYAGGAGNDPGTWTNTMGMNVIPGLWCLHSGSGDSASTVQTKMESWENSYDIDGGFMWLYDDMMQLSSPNATADYANAILTGCSGSTGGTYPSISGNTTYEWIETVNAGTLNNTSGSNSGYGDYTSIVTDMSKGNSYNVELTPGFAGRSYNEYWKIWIDFNQDGDFSDAGEEVFSASGRSAVSGSLSIPSTALTGQTRMRVVMKYNSAPSSSGSIGDGEAEDYTINIQ